MFLHSHHVVYSKSRVHKSNRFWSTKPARTPGRPAQLKMNNVRLFVLFDLGGEAVEEAVES